jgi:hypothetical protein
MKYYQFTNKTSFSGDNPVQTGLPRVPRYSRKQAQKVQK